NEDMEAVVNVPGMGNILRRRDLPDFCRTNNPTSEVMIQRISEQAKQFSKASGFILNTFQDLEQPLLSFICSHFPTNNIYVVGPLHQHLMAKLSKQEETIRSYNCSNSFWHEDRSCIDWLNNQPSKSVIFCSFGSQVVITKDQLIEFWQGLVNSGSRFLWIQRPRSVIGMDDDIVHEQQQLPSGLLKGVRENGFITNWGPQEEILSHPSIGGFLTHSGWNSTIESIVAGVPMICWPHYVDQLVISRYVSHVWKFGLDMKDTCDRIVIENMSDRVETVCKACGVKGHLTEKCWTIIGYPKWHSRHGKVAAKPGNRESGASSSYSKWNVGKNNSTRVAATAQSTETKSETVMAGANMRDCGALLNGEKEGGEDRAAMEN
ncbi:hypothetical protein SOVF_112160, partial [Spinacia oleracea]